jgi:ATP-dependent helicase/nuclease subunit B
MEQALIMTPDLPGTARAEVLSFRRMAWRVLGEVGGQALPRVSELGKRMVLRSILRKRRDDLKLFHRAAGQERFSDRLALTITELRTQGLGPFHLEAKLKELQEQGRGESVLAHKLHDLSLIIRELDSHLEGKLSDPDDILRVLARKIPQSDWLKEAKIWIDGFAGFNPAEYRVLEGLLETAAEVSVAPGDKACCRNEPAL